METPCLGGSASAPTRTRHPIRGHWETLSPTYSMPRIQPAGAAYVNSWLGKDAPRSRFAGLACRSSVHFLILLPLLLRRPFAAAAASPSKPYHHDDA
jgi:hypothetical protein